jgi:hypothetical protein
MRRSVNEAEVLGDIVDHPPVAAGLQVGGVELENDRYVSRGELAAPHQDGQAIWNTREELIAAS